MGAQLLARQDLTCADYAAIDDGLRYELIHGELLMTPAPGTFHQSLSTNLTVRIASYVEKNDLGSVFAAPTDVIPDDWNTVRPDILFIGRERLEYIKPRTVIGPRDLVVGIISNGTVEILVMTKEEYKLAAFASGEEAVASTATEGPTIPLEEIMPDRDRQKNGTES